MRETTSAGNLAIRRLLWAEEVAVLLGVPVKTLYQWRYKGVGPAGVRVGRHLRYRAAERNDIAHKRLADLDDEGVWRTTQVRPEPLLTRLAELIQRDLPIP